MEGDVLVSVTSYLDSNSPNESICHDQNWFYLYSIDVMGFVHLVLKCVFVLMLLNFNNIGNNL